MQLSTFQDGFSAALLGQASPPAWLQSLTAQPGFAVYSNTVIKGCIDALQASYPTVCQLVGEDWFRAAAAVHARTHPPRDGRLMDYGAEFAHFLAAFAPAAALPYLPAVAHLDRCWTECHLAADAAAVDHSWWANQRPENLASLRLRPHPAARWSWCHEHPAFALWKHHREGQSVPEALAWAGDGALLTRPGPVVVWRALPRAGCVFLDACGADLTLEAAATQALTAEPATDFAQLLSTLLDAGALCHPTNA